MSTVILQTSPIRTGSTVLVNVLYGLICNRRPVVNVPIANTSPLVIDTDITILKTHDTRINYWTGYFKDHNLYFVTSERGDRKLDSKYDSRCDILRIQYSDLLETPSHTIEDIVTLVHHEVSRFLPKDIQMDAPAAIARIKRMNQTYETIKHLPFTYFDSFFHIHGSHRCRP